MDTLIVAVLSFVGFIVAYHTYGRWLGQKIFRLDKDALTPSVALKDDVDYCPTHRDVIFGHHFTSIAGTGPIVGPAIAVFWGWLPALIWVLVGSIFIGAVHDFGALVVSMRNRGQTIGDVAGHLIGPRARILFLLILFFSLAVVLGIFGLVIAMIFATYPESVLSVWIEIPLAVGIGWWAYRKKGKLLVPSLLALGVMYAAIYVGTRVPLKLPLKTLDPDTVFGNAVVVWTLVLFVYCFIASVLPVWTLLQPRDFINSHELKVALVLLVLGLAVASLTGEAQLMASAPAVARQVPEGALPIWPFLFIVVACGACSGFHSLVSSGTTSKQIKNEHDARYVGYGSMLLEAALAVIVIMACVAGLGMGLHKKESVGEARKIAFFVSQPYQYVDQTGEDGRQVTGSAAWKARYSGKWSDFKLPQKVGAFIDGGGNFLARLGIPFKMAVGIMAVLVASFAATTLDTATRLQRYVVQELGKTVRFKPLQNKYLATGIAVATGIGMAMVPHPKLGFGAGGMILWPVFGATNQLLGCLAFAVIIIYLRRKGWPNWFVIIPAVFMLIMPGWAMIHLLITWAKAGSWLLFTVGICVEVMAVWLLIETALVWQDAHGNYPDTDPLPAPADEEPAPEQSTS